MEPAGSSSVWTSWLEALPPEVAPALVPLLERLASLFDPLGTPAAGSGVLALFDAGPGQLGAPRVAQIAILLALARRARSAGARFAWGTFQETEAALSLSAGADGVRELIGARTAHEATGAQLAAWRLRLEERPEWDEAWVIGSPRLGAPPELPGATHLQVWDALDPAARRIGVSLRRGERERGGPARPARRRLLRAPAAPRRRRASPRGRARGQPDPRRRLGS